MASLRQLQYLVALSETRHYRLAAERMNVSQPTLSAQLQALEQRLGVQLAERNRPPVLLTPAGEEILTVARRIIAQMKDIQDLAQMHKCGMHGTVRLGLPISVSGYLLPSFICRLHADYPGLRLYIREDLPEALPENLSNGKYDLLIVPQPLPHEDFTTLRILREPLYLAVPFGHPLAEKAVIEPEELRGQAVLALEKGHALHEQVHHICEEFGAQLRPDFEGTSLSTLHHMTATGLGLSFLPGLYARTIESPSAGIKLLTIKGKPLSRSIGLVWRTSSPRRGDFLKIGAYLKAAVKARFPDFAVMED